MGASIDQDMPTQIASYRVLRRLGSGGMGAVYEGRNDRIGRHAAIKVLQPRWADDADVLRRFFNEARAANAIHHPGIVQVVDHGQCDDGSPFLVMDLLRGESLGARLRRQPRLAEDAPRVVRQIAGAMAAAHEHGIIHRDLKPDNVMLVPDPEVPGGERAKILDFGVAKLAATQGEGNDPDPATRTGAFLGTPTYASPEQCSGEAAITDRADVYALGVILYRLLCGAPPFTGTSLAIAACHLTQEPPPLAERAPQVMPALVALCHQMLAKRPAARPSMVEIVGRLSALANLPPSATLPLPALGPPAAGPDQASQTDLRGQKEGPRPLPRRALGLSLLGGVALVALFAALRSTPSAPHPLDAALSAPAPADLAPVDLARPAPAARPSEPPAPSYTPASTQTASPPRPPLRPAKPQKRPPKPSTTTEDDDVHIMRDGDVHITR